MMLKTQRLLIGLTIYGLAAASACAQESLMNQAQQAGAGLVQQASDLGSQTGQQVFQQLQQQQQQQQQQFIDPQRLLEFGMNPVGSGLKYLMPNTFQGVSNDLGGAYMVLSNGANRGYNSLVAQLNSVGESLKESLQASEQSILKRYAQISQQQEDIVRRMYEIVNNPEQLCRQIREEGQSAYSKAGQQASSMLEQVTHRPSTSWFGK